MRVSSRGSIFASLHFCRVYEFLNIPGLTSKMQTAFFEFSTFQIQFIATKIALEHNPKLPLHDISFTRFFASFSQ